jgi:hypothetical protein
VAHAVTRLQPPQLDVGVRRQKRGRGGKDVRIGSRHTGSLFELGSAAGAKPIEIARDGFRITAIASDATRVYWASLGISSTPK